ncbi:MAG: FAD-dependent oxidoreductase [Stellaceae bacterium]
MRPGHAEIAGAGFAGLVAAIALAERGWSVRVHEIGSELRAFGAGIFMWENGARVLKAIGAYDTFLAGAHEALVYETRHGDTLVAADAFSLERRGTRMFTMTRQHLYASILGVAQRVGIDFVTGSEAVGADPDGVLMTADAARHRADLVIGADGVKSPVRQSLGLLKERNACADGIIRVLVPRDGLALGPGDWDRVIDFWHFGEPALRILYTPCSPGELYLAMMAPVRHDAASIPVRTEIWMDAFPQLAPAIRRIGPEARYDAYETSKLTRWSFGRVAIIGDAAHAMVPTLGQGAGVAVMNALALAVSLERATGIEAGLAAWEAAARPLTERTQERSDRAARERHFAAGRGWSEENLLAARSIPAGTEHVPRML